MGLQWLTEARLRTALLVLLALLAGVVVVRGPSARTNAASGAAISTVVAAAFTGSDGVTNASGGYLPDVGLVMSVDTTTDSSKVASWLSERLAPLASTVSALPKDEAMIWTVRSGGAKPATTYFKVPVRAITQPAQWTSSAEPPAATATTASTAAAKPNPTAQASVAASSTASGTGSAAASSAPSSASSGTATTTPSASGTASAAAGTGKDDFAKDSGSWNTIAGTWSVADGVYKQDDASGYDFISQYASAAPATFTVSVRMRAVGNVLGAGFMLGQPKKGQRNGATLIDVTDSRYLRWGTYSTGGTYQFVGGNALPASAKKEEWHTLKVVTTASKTAVFWDDKNVGEFKPVAAGGVGLVTSVSSVEFDDFSLTSS